MSSGPAVQGAPAPAAAAELKAAASNGDVGASASQLLELPLFYCKESYVYRVPPATTVGHRAELWDVNKWLATVSIKVVQVDDDAFVRLLDDKTGELFAECPVPTDRPLTTAVEAVIDSSRYFVIRIVDRETQRHAFIGIGFRERNEASDFNAALLEYLQYLKRKRTAEAMHKAYEERAQSAAEAAGGDPETAAALPHADYSIKEGESLTLRINARPVSSPSGGGFVSSAARRGRLGKSFSLIMDGSGGSVAALSPPPAPGRTPKAHMSLSPCLEAGDGSPISGGSSPASAGSAGASAGWMAHARMSGAGDAVAGGAATAAGGSQAAVGAGAGLEQRLQGLHLQGQQAAQALDGANQEVGLSCGASAASSTTAAALDEDDFGDFEAAP